MRAAVLKVFDEYLPLGTTLAAATYLPVTPTHVNEQLGKHDALAIQVIVDNITPSTTTSAALNLWVEHSMDGRNWIERNDQSNTFTANPDIHILIPTTVPAGVFTQMWSDSCQGGSNSGTNGTGPLLNLVRFRMYFTNSDMAGHVQVFVTQRNL